MNLGAENLDIGANTGDGGGDINHHAHCSCSQIPLWNLATITKIQNLQTIHL